MKDIYKNLYNDKKTLGALQNNPRIRVMAKIANSLGLENKDILDIGCYDGTFLSLLENRYNNLYGLEASDYGARESTKKGIRVKQFFFDDQTRMPFDDQTFDLIVAGEIIEHIYDTDFFISEIGRLLKPGGKLLISTPNIASLGRRALLFFGKNPLIELSPNENDSSGHIRYFTFATLRQLLQKHGFKPLISVSDAINFSNTGQPRSEILAQFFPNFGCSIIMLLEQ